MNYKSEFKLHIPDCKEEFFDMNIKLFQKIDDIYLIAVTTSERKKVSFLKEPNLTEEGEIEDFSTKPNIDLFFHLDFQKLKNSSTEVYIKEGWIIEDYDSTLYYFEHLYVENVNIKIKHVKDNQYEIEVKGEVENNYEGDDNIRFYFKDLFDADFSE